MPTSVKKELNDRASKVSSWLENCLKSINMPQGLKVAMEYSLLAGGKRVRPVLCLASAGIFSDKLENIMPFACAIECIHTYSLIHDDLPAMDNDDLRRGKASNHKKFSEATAILAGDALLTDAFFFMTQLGIDKNSKDNDTPSPDRILRAIAELSKAAGSAGMVGGQFLDMDYTAYENNALSQAKLAKEPSTDQKLKSLAHMHAMKTGALLSVSCVSGAILAGADEKGIEALRNFGKDFGAAYQIIDDILDITGTEEELGKPVGSDADMNKVTYPSLIGLKRSQKMAKEKTELAVSALSPYTGLHVDFLRTLANYMLMRVS